MQKSGMEALSWQPTQEFIFKTPLLLSFLTGTHCSVANNHIHLQMVLAP